MTTTNKQKSRQTTSKPIGHQPTRTRQHHRRQEERSSRTKKKPPPAPGPSSWNYSLAWVPPGALSFEKAHAKAPCVIFIGRIDAAGRKRHGSATSGGEMEQDQTLNQLLVEMDGFSTSEGVVVLAATNRMDVLNPALTRSGRFDRHVDVPRPDVKARLEIPQSSHQGQAVGADVDLRTSRSRHRGWSARMANIINEAAIRRYARATRRSRRRDFQEAVEKALTGGIQQKSRVMGEEERRIDCLS